MTKNEFILVFNMGRSYSNMPFGFNDLMKNHWKYKDSDAALEAVKTDNSIHIEDMQRTTIECKVCGKSFGDKISLYQHYDELHNNRY